MSVGLEHLPILQKDFTVDRVDAPEVVEISFVKYSHTYPSGRNVDREKVLQVFGTDEKREFLYGCHTIEESNGLRLFNIGGDQNELLTIPVKDITRYQILR